MTEKDIWKCNFDKQVQRNLLRKMPTGDLGDLMSGASIK